MGDKVKKETNKVILDVNPVEAEALTYDSECILVKYHKNGWHAHTP